MPKFSNELKEVAIQAAHGATTTQFSNKDLSDAVRKMIEELGSDTLDYSTYRRRKHDLFEFIEETVAPIVNERTAEIFGQFAEYKISLSVIKTNSSSKILNYSLLLLSLLVTET